MLFAAILAPVVGLMIAFLTFFTSALAFIRGFHTGMSVLLSVKTQEKTTKVNDIWENHIQRMKNDKR